MREKPIIVPSGYLILLVNLMIFVAAIAVLILAKGSPEKVTLILTGVFLILLGLVMMPGNFTVQPNEAVVLQLFGRYIGTVKEPGLRWSNPFYSKRKVSLRARNFETNHLKVNDHDGNPIEIAAVVVWRVVDSAEATFQVDDYSHYVNVQSEAALRNLATVYSYDAHEPTDISLRGSTDLVAERLKTEVQSRLSVAGVEVTEARITHLAYAPEIAAAMLQRQQAGAIIAARSKIVEGAVSMVEMALEQLGRRSIVNLDEERKAAMVSNLLVVLSSERNTQPVVNAGTLHH
ncbi:MAG: SPFH domain-containing protein [Acidobacteria bacterium]|nr:SPFH domain-containing protein [Acidobacteriota bacterium]